MSFGFSPGDVVLLVQSAWKTVQNSRKACGEYAELTRETTSLHVNLQRLERETSKPESPINRPSDTCRQDLAPIVDGCGKALDVLDRILEKYNALSDKERSKRKLWKAVRFGNGELANVEDLRLKLTYYTSNLSLFLNMVSMGSVGIVEKQMREAGGDLKDIRRAVNGITAHLMSGAKREGSVLTDYANDDKAVWRAFRRELIQGGFSSNVIQGHKDTIQAYVQELGSRGILDDEDLKDSGNVSEAFEYTETAPATPRSRDKAMGLSESKSGAARDAVSPRTATTARLLVEKTRPQGSAPMVSHVNELSGTGKRDPGEHGVFPRETTWFLRGKDFRCAFKYIYNEPITDFWEMYRGLNLIATRKPEAFEALSDPLVAERETLEFQEESKGFLKVAELRTQRRKPDWERIFVLKLSELFDTSDEDAQDSLSGLLENGKRSAIISDLMHYGLRWIDARPKKWRIPTWPSPREKTKHEGRKDGDEGKRSTAPSHAAPAVGKGTQDPSSTTKKDETKKDEEIQRTGYDSGTEEQKRSWGPLVKEAQLMNKPPDKNVTQAFHQPRHL